MLNSDSFETIESHFLDSATLVASNGVGEENSEATNEDEGSEIDLDEDGILIMPPQLEQAAEVENNGSSASLSLPESVPSTVGSFTVTNHDESNKKEGTSQDAEGKKDSINASQGREAGSTPVLKNAAFQPMVASLGYLAFFTLLIFNTRPILQQNDPLLSTISTTLNESGEDTLAQLVKLESELEGLNHIKYENDHLHTANEMLGQQMRSMKDAHSERDALKLVNAALEEKLRLVEGSCFEDQQAVEALELKIEELSMSLSKFEALHHNSERQLEEITQTAADLAEERENLLMINEQLKAESKYSNKQGNTTTSGGFAWEGTDEQRLPLMDNCWLRAQLEWGDCANSTKQCVKSRFDTAKEFLFQAKKKYETSLMDIKDTLLYFAGENTTSYKKPSADFGGLNFTDFADDIPIVDTVSRRFESLKQNEHVRSVGKAARSVLSGVAFATAATVVVSSAFLGEVFGGDGSE